MPNVTNLWSFLLINKIKLHAIVRSWAIKQTIELTDYVTGLSKCVAVDQTRSSRERFDMYVLYISTTTTQPIGDRPITFGDNWQGYISGKNAANSQLLKQYFVLLILLEQNKIVLYRWTNSKFKEILLDLFSTPIMIYIGLYPRPSSGWTTNKVGT